MKDKPNFPYNVLSNSANYRTMLPPFQNSNKLYIQNRLVTYIDALHSRNYSSPRTL